MISIASDRSFNSEIDHIIDTIIDLKRKYNLNIEHKIFGNILEFRMKSKNSYNEIKFVIRRDNKLTVDIFSENDSFLGEILWKV
ncbi:hypothetical protein [Acidianus manzaensis]|uniref:Uncharacterized protein n=1 Tax=Acidianus manzaensis TaxID=282676 RepID=A0A1W6JXW6_9CREN|nr:hypothetical protein [Acidianus manzaensis]ARM75044.1 hypothetical protein B6F84_02705 [Acidianus manzaensis]